MSTLVLTNATRHRIEVAIERLMLLLDTIDGDADFEEQHDAEPDDTDHDLAGAHTDLELCYGDYDPPGRIEGGQGL